VVDRTKRLRARWDSQRIPPDVRDVVAGASGERLLSWGRDRSGEPLVATDVGLWAYGERLSWLEIDHVGWVDHTLTILAIDGEVREVPVKEERDLPAMIRTKIEGSVLASAAVSLLASGPGAMIIARRAGRSAVEWHVRYDPGIPQDDPEFQERVNAVLTSMRADLGI
jgi:hypothetical protein